MAESLLSVGAATVGVRSGRPEDAAGIRALGEAVVPATYAPLDPAYAALMLREWWSPEAVSGSLARLPHWVAQDEQGRVVGVANLGEHDGTPTMWKLYVHPDHQGSGVGARLLSEVVAAVGDQPLELEVVEGNDRALEFYRRHGFTEVRRTPERAYPDVTLIWMRRDHG